MGYQYFDKYTYLHFAVGIVAYFWNISLINWVILHTIFEVLENTQMGMNIINKYIWKIFTFMVSYRNHHLNKIHFTT